MGGGTDGPEVGTSYQNVSRKWISGGKSECTTVRILFLGPSLILIHLVSLWKKDLLMDILQNEDMESRNRCNEA